MRNGRIKTQSNRYLGFLLGSFKFFSFNLSFPDLLIPSMHDNVWETLKPGERKSDVAIVLSFSSSPLYFIV